MSRPASSRPSARTQSWPPTPTSPAGSPPNATSGSSPPTTSTPDLRCSLTALIQPTYWQSTAPRHSLRCWTRRDRSANSLLRNGSPACHPIRPNSRRRGSSPPAPRVLGPGQQHHQLPPQRSPAWGSAILLAHVKEWNLDPRRAVANPLHSVNDVKRRLAEAAPIGPEQRWAALAGQLDQRLLRQGDWPALAQLLQRVDDQGLDVAALTRAVTRTPLNDLPAQDLRYRLAAHLDLGDDVQRPPVHTSAAKTTTRRPRPHREVAVSFAATTRTPPR